MSPLTRFLIDLLTRKLAHRNPARIAREYGISPAHASGYLRMLGEVW